MTGVAEAGGSKRRLGDLYCVRCNEPREARDLDRLLWCESCIVGARQGAARASWITGAAVAAALAAWIWLVQRPSDLILGGWIGIVVAAFWLGSRLGREVAFGFSRFRHRPG